MSRACCFTGHRELPSETDPAYSVLKEALQRAVERAVTEFGCTTFYAGGAIGFDLLAAETVLRNQAVHPELNLVLCVPYLGYNARFSPKDLKRYRAVSEGALETRILSDRYTPFCFSQRNRYMVDRSDVLIAYVRRMQSGSGQTLRMAKNRELEILLL